MILKFYIDDGNIIDLRTAKLLEENGFKGIFYIAPYYSKIKVMSPSQIRELSEKHEIGGHTLTHQMLTDLPPEYQRVELQESKCILEGITGKPVTKLAYPKGWFNKEVIEIVKECGFKEARTMKQWVSDISGYNQFEIPVSIHFYPERWDKWKEYYLKAKEINGYFGVTCHGIEMNRYDLWEEYEKMLKFISKDQKNENQNS